MRRQSSKPELPGSITSTSTQSTGCSASAATAAAASPAGSTQKPATERKSRSSATMSASAAALTALAVTVAVPAIAGDGRDVDDQDSFVTCLQTHGLEGNPDGAALKPWLQERLERGPARQAARDRRVERSRSARGRQRLLSAG